MRTAELPLWQDEAPVPGEAGVRELYGKPHVFSFDAMHEDRAARLLDARPAPASLTDRRLTLAIYACIGRDLFRPDVRAWHNALHAERDARKVRAQVQEAA